MKIRGCLALVLLAAAPSSFGAGLDAESAKQVMTGAWIRLKPEAAAERNVLFQSVRASADNQFIVTVVLRDYEAGYPPNHYYGRTCVGRLENETYKLWSDGAQWHVDGRMTPDIPRCAANPGAGVSAISLASLAGSQAAPGGRMAAATPPVRAGGMVEGSYECWSGSTANGILNFSVRAGSVYVDSQGGAGRFAVNPANGRVAFRGGLLDGGIPAGMYAVYHEPQGRPTLSIRGTDGGEAVFCQKR